MQLLVPFVFCHVVPLIIAIWGAFRRSPAIHVPAIVVLMLDLLGYSMAQSISFDRFPAMLGWAAFGPVFAPIELAQAAVSAPLWTLPFIICGIAAGVLIWRWLWRKAHLRAWAFAAVLGGVMAAMLLAEVSLEATMRIRAAQQMPGYCALQRVPAATMLGTGLSEFGTGRTTHGWISDGTSVRYWSVKGASFEQPFACQRDAWVCRC